MFLDLTAAFDTVERSILAFDQQISSVVKTNFFQLSLLSKVKYCFPPCYSETVKGTFITSQLDYCNSLDVSPDQSLLLEHFV